MSYFDQQLDRLAFCRLSDLGLKLNPKKCQIGMSKEEYLGYEISAEEIGADKKRTEAISAVPTSQNPERVTSIPGSHKLLLQIRKGLCTYRGPLQDLVAELS